MVEKAVGAEGLAGAVYPLSATGDPMADGFLPHGGRRRQSCSGAQSVAFPGDFASHAYGTEEGDELTKSIFALTASGRWMQSGWWILGLEAQRALA